MPIHLVVLFVVALAGLAVLFPVSGSYPPSMRGNPRSHPGDLDGIDHPVNDLDGVRHPVDDFDL